MRELLSNNSLFVGQLCEDKSLALRAHDLIFLLLLIITQQFTAGADLFLKQQHKLHLCPGHTLTDHLAGSTTD